MPTGFQSPGGPGSHRAPSKGLLARLKSKLPGGGASTGQTAPGAGPAAPGAGPAAPGGRPRHGGPGGSGPKNMGLMIIAAVVLSLALVGGLLLSSLSGGDGEDPEQPKRPALPQDFVQLALPDGKIRVAVPRAWPRGQETTWTPNAVGLNDAQARPVLRATPSVPGFVGDGRSPGVFIGLTTDVRNGSLPPRNAGQHPQCTKGNTEQYTSPDKSLTGTITRFTACQVGTPAVAEVGLRHSSGKFGAWVRVKETDKRNLTKTILDNLRLAAP